MNEREFLTNYSSTTFLNRILHDLERCTSFSFSVSFIKKAGLSLMSEKIEEALARGAKGKLITSTYQNFTDIPSLELFLSLQNKYPNFECHLEFNSFGEDGFHTKGYLFSFGESSEVIIGSSNITYFALIKNQEWDLAVFEKEGSPLLESIQKEFDYLWNKTNPLDAAIIKKYQMHLSYAIERWDMDFIDPDNTKTIKPNQMQTSALKEISRFRSMGENRTLVVAATASGKTYLAAFDALNFNAKRLLFLVHKDVVLLKAMESFAEIFGSSRTYGLYTGESKDLNSDFVFASNQMLAKHLELFSPTEFDYIVIDEVHHATASTYRKIVNYFKPQFLLGLTATPDRMDGESVYDIFDKNVAYNLSLRDALMNRLIVPFHYYGIKDSLIDYSDNDSREGIQKLIRSVAKEENCRFIDEEIRKHKNPDAKLRCIGFCRNVDHAQLMARNMSNFGYVCEYLTGSNSTGEREKVFSRLEDPNDPLTMVFAVDILNEGVDIPSMNMALFLRPTDSSTIFIQQLGRGLRKYDNKEYLVVLDFIANSYKRSAQIGLALGTLTKSGTTEKSTISEIIQNQGEGLGIPGVEINLDKESIEEILESINNTNFNQFAFLKQDYLHLKEYLKLKPGEYPKHVDFINEEISADLLRYTKKFDSYYEFLLKVKEEVPFFSEEEKNVIATLSWFLPLIRKEDYLLVQCLINKGPMSFDELKKALSETEEINEESLEHSVSLLEGNVSCTFKSNHIDLVKEEGGLLKLNFLCEKASFKEWLLDLIEYGLTRYKNDYPSGNGLLKLYAKYTESKAFMALNCKNMFHMKGIEEINDRLFLFVTIHKDLDIDDAKNYADKFLSSSILQWESQNETTLGEAKANKLLSHKNADVFIRKRKEEDGVGLPFVYVGKASLTNVRQSNNPGKTLLLDLELASPIPEEYHYDFDIKQKEA